MAPAVAPSKGQVVPVADKPAAGRDTGAGPAFAVGSGKETTGLDPVVSTEQAEHGVRVHVEVCFLLFDGDRINFSTGLFQKQRFSFFCFQYGIAGHMVAAALSTLAEGLQEAAVDYAEAQAKLASSAAGLFQRVGANVGRLAEDLLEKSVAPEGSVS